jgi:hypothetical protein
MYRRAAVLAIAGVAGVSAAYAADQAQPDKVVPAGTQVAKASPAPAPQQPASTTGTARLDQLNSNGPGQPPKVVVHHNTDAADAHDGRVDLGGVRVSVGQTREVTVYGPDGKSTTHQSAVLPPAVFAEGIVMIPDNTLGPGEPMWQIRERQQAELAIVKATADLARRDADRARPYYNDYTYQRDILAENASFGRFSLGGWGWNGIGGLGGFDLPPIGPAPHGAVTSSVILDDQNGSTAQRAFTAASIPSTSSITAARDAIHNTASNNSLPRIAPTINAVDAAHTNAAKEHIPH